VSHVANIGSRGISRRRRIGIAWAIVAAIALIVMTVMHAPRWSTLLLAIPICLAAIGLLQAREKT
jgi:hypothetical protein